MKIIATFIGPEIGLTAPYRYTVVELQSLGRVQLHYLQPGKKTWEIGHSKDIPLGMTAEDVADIMRSFISGQISHTEYNERVPN